MATESPLAPTARDSSVTEDTADDDDIDFEPATEESDELEYFETIDEDGAEDEEGDRESEFHGGSTLCAGCKILY